jgi:hypothetical protein
LKEKLREQMETINDINHEKIDAEEHTKKSWSTSSDNYVKDRQVEFGKEALLVEI